MTLFIPSLLQVVMKMELSPLWDLVLNLWHLTWNSSNLFVGLSSLPSLFFLSHPLVYIFISFLLLPILKAMYFYMDESIFLSMYSSIFLVSH